MKTTKLILLSALTGCASLGAFEGSYDYADLLKNGGTFYSNAENPYIQKARVFGRFQYQVASSNADVSGGESEWTGFDEIRRARIGSEIKFLNNFKFKGNADVDLGEGLGDDNQGGFRGWDDVGLTADLAGLFNLDYVDALKLTVGKKKIKVGQDVHSSSTKIKTVERSRVSDGALRPDNSTGVLLSVEKNGVGVDLGFFSNASDDEFDFWSEGDRGSFIYASTQFALGEGNVILDFVKTVNADEDASGLSTGLNYGVSAAYETSYSDVDVVYNVFAGQNLDDSEFYGVSVLGSTMVTEKLEAVGRAYYWAGDDGAVAWGKRYARQASQEAGNEVKTGDSHVSVYGGLNYYFSGHHSKVMTGVEWESLSGDDDASATTLFAAYRMMF